MDGSSFGEYFNNWIKLTIFLGILAIFGVWKIIEIVIWLFSHIRIV